MTESTLSKEAKEFEKYLKMSHLIQLWGMPTDEVESGNIGTYDTQDLYDYMSQIKQSIILTEKKRIISRAKDHYWDSLEKDKEMVILHIESLIKD